MYQLSYDMTGNITTGYNLSNLYKQDYVNYYKNYWSKIPRNIKFLDVIVLNY